ncbi:MAG: S46 family peptidase [Bacteroidia bacterium]|nr:MAG: S46 family peptidase [Bacteroidia bacterium]
MTMKKNLFLVLAVLLVAHLPAKADEGMWLPFLIDEALYEEMSRMGLNMSQEEIFSFTEASIKDAVVSFGGFCTGEIISDRGLVLTNHHCGYGRIQSHSTVDNDLLTDGFWAMTLEDELPNEGLFVRFLLNVEDVTAEILSVLSDDMTESERSAAIREKSNELTAAATEGSHYTANVRPMFAGNYFYLFTYETYTDVRLVGAPPSDIGAFGGDTDNWEWPRHTGDFALFRVYTAPDGSPADYDPENVPLRPRYHLPVSARGVQENDFAMILGYSGRTERYLTSYGIDYRLENMYPVRIDIRRAKLDIIEEAMAASDEVRIKYASKHSGISNYWKNFIGMSESLQRLNVADSKRELENAFHEWVQADPGRTQTYGHVINDFQRVYEGLKQFRSHNYIFLEAMATGPDALRVANAFNNLNTLLEEEGDEEEIRNVAERLQGMAERTYRNYDMDVDRNLWEAMFEMYHELAPSDQLPDVFETISNEYANDFAAYANSAYAVSVFADADRLEAFLENPVPGVLNNDPVFIAAQSVYGTYRELMQQMEDYSTLLQRTERFFLRGLMEMEPETSFYPDANSTMRFTYGTVNGYHPRDAVYYDYYTTLSGVMEKEDPGHHEFIVPEKLKELYQTEDFGPYATNGLMVVNFITNNDITGGNSGSPVINGDGHLIGVAFDANWEGMSGDILFEHDMQKAINVDVRYMLFVIDKFAGASHLIDEMTIVW